MKNMVKHNKTTNMRGNFDLKKFAARHNLVIFVTATAALLLVCVYVLIQILLQQYTISTTNSSSTITFNETTVNNLNSFYSSDQNPTYQNDLPAGRNNPFAE